MYPNSSAPQFPKIKLKVLKKLVAHFYKVVIKKVIFLYFLCEILTGQGKLVGKRCNGQAHSPATKKSV